MIAEVVRNGRRVGITAVSHKVISKLLQENLRGCPEHKMPLRAVQKANESDGCTDPMVTQLNENEDSGCSDLGSGTSGGGNILALGTRRNGQFG